MAGTCHVLWGVYGLWLPRGDFHSWSEQVTHWELALYGRTLSPLLPNRVEPAEYLLSKQAAKRSLKAQSAFFSPAQRQAMAEAMSNFVRAHRVTIRACAILPRHVQVVLETSPFERVEAAPALRAELTRQMLRSHRKQPYLLEPIQRSYWNRLPWKRELMDNTQILQAIAYVNNLPQQEQSEPQNWPFVMNYVSQHSCREDREAYTYSSQANSLSLAG